MEISKAIEAAEPINEFFRKLPEGVVNILEPQSESLLRECLTYKCVIAVATVSRSARKLYTIDSNPIYCRAFEKWPKSHCGPTAHSIAAAILTNIINFLKFSVYDTGPQKFIEFSEEYEARTKLNVEEFENSIHGQPRNIEEMSYEDLCKRLGDCWEHNIGNATELLSLRVRMRREIEHLTVDQAVWSPPIAKQKLRQVFAENGEIEMPETTFRRRIKDGKIFVHPDDAANKNLKSIRVAASCLPDDWESRLNPPKM